MQVLSRPPSGTPALVLNADFRPLSYYPLSLWPWQETIKAVFLGRFTDGKGVLQPDGKLVVTGYVARTAEVKQVLGDAGGPQS